jgi:hypothetical protein
MNEILRFRSLHFLCIIEFRVEAKALVAKRKGTRCQVSFAVHELAFSISADLSSLHTTTSETDHRMDLGQLRGWLVEQEAWCAGGSSLERARAYMGSARFL